MSDAIFIRELSEDDWELWRMLRLEALADAPYAFGSTLAQWSGSNDRESRWRSRLHGAGCSWVAIRETLPVGMVSATPPADGEAELVSMWVAPTARGVGIGDLLVQTVIGWAKTQRLDRLRLFVREANNPAIRLYQRNGFIDTMDRQAAEGGTCEIAMLHAIDNR